jgi:hypothetical protein
LKDPKLTVLELLEDGWGLSFTPRFSSEWYDEGVDFPQVTVSHVVTSPRFIAFSEDLQNADRRINAAYAVDVWSRGDEEKRWQMLQEVDRILKSKVNSPGGDLELALVSSWQDLDEGQLKPSVFRSQLRLEVLYYG